MSRHTAPHAKETEKKLLIMTVEPIRASETHCLSFLPPCCVCCLFLKQSVPLQQPNLSLTEPCRPPSHALNVSSQKYSRLVPPRVPHLTGIITGPKVQCSYVPFICLSSFTRQVVLWHWDMLTVRKKGRKVRSENRNQILDDPILALISAQNRDASK